MRDESEESKHSPIGAKFAVQLLGALNKIPSAVIRVNSTLTTEPLGDAVTSVVMPTINNTTISGPMNVDRIFKALDSRYW